MMLHRLENVGEQVHLSACAGSAQEKLTPAQPFSDGTSAGPLDRLDRA
jgi:hypothetical protein